MTLNVTPLYYVTKHFKFALINKIDRKSKPRWIEKTGDGFLYLLNQPFKLIKNLACSVQDPRIVTLYLTASAIFANCLFFYSKETTSALNYFSKYTTVELPKFLKKYIPEPLHWSPKFTVFVFLSSIVSAVGIRAIGRFNDAALKNDFFGNDSNNNNVEFDD